MARTRRIVRDGHYHLMSRTTGREFLLGSGTLKTKIVAALKAAADFSGVKLKAYCIMDDHFHVVCEIRKPGSQVSEREVLRRIGVLKGTEFADMLESHWAELRRIGMEAAVEDQLRGWRRRMHDVSQFVKTFKETVDRLYKSRQSRCGGLWSGRFKSTLIDSQGYLGTCIRYVELNPVRAGIVRRTADYAWSSASDCPTHVETAVPHESRLLRRVAQISGGKVFGGHRFVMEVTSSVGREYGGGKGARPVEDWAYSSHGYRLAARVDAA